MKKTLSFAPFGASSVPATVVAALHTLPSGFCPNKPGRKAVWLPFLSCRGWVPRKVKGFTIMRRHSDVAGGDVQMHSSYQDQPSNSGESGTFSLYLQHDHRAYEENPPPSEPYSRNLLPVDLLWVKVEFIALCPAKAFSVWTCKMFLYKNTWMWYSLRQPPYNAFSIQKG